MRQNCVISDLGSFKICLLLSGGVEKRENMIHKRRLLTLINLLVTIPRKPWKRRPTSFHRESKFLSQAQRGFPLLIAQLLQPNRFSKLLSFSRSLIDFRSTPEALSPRSTQSKSNAVRFITSPRNPHTETETNMIFQSTFVELEQKGRKNDYSISISSLMSKLYWKRAPRSRLRNEIPGVP